MIELSTWWCDSDIDVSGHIHTMDQKKNGKRKNKHAIIALFVTFLSTGYTSLSIQKMFFFLVVILIIVALIVYHETDGNGLDKGDTDTIIKSKDKTKQYMVNVLKKDHKDLFPSIHSSDPMDLPKVTKRSFRVVLKYGMHKCKSKAGKSDYCKCIENHVSTLFSDLAKQYCVPSHQSGPSFGNIPNNLGSWAFWFPLYMKSDKVDVDRTVINSDATTNCGGQDWHWINVNKGLFIACGIPRSNS